MAVSNVYADEADDGFCDMVKVANTIAKRFNLNLHIDSILQCDHEYFVAIYHAMLGEYPPGLRANASTEEEQAHNIQCVVDSLASDVLGIDLSHIDVHALVRRDRLAVNNLLEIFDGLLECLLEELDHEEAEGNCSAKEDSSVFVDNQNASKTLEEVFPPSKTENRLKEGSWLETGESTNELISEGNAVENKQQSVPMTFPTENSNNQNFPSKSSTNWSALLDRTLTDKEGELGALNEVGVRPRKAFEVEKKQRVSVHKHTHHHFHHQPKIPTSTIATQLPRTTDQKDQPSMSFDSLNSADTSSGNESKTRNAADILSGKSRVMASQPTATSKCIQTQRSTVIDSSVQTEEMKDYEKNIQSHAQYLAEKSCADMDTTTRSKQLSDFQHRLNNLRDNFQPSKPLAEISTTKASEACSSSVLKVDVHPKKSVVKESKVSFQVDSLPSTTATLSDSEVDYSPIAQRRKMSRREELLKRSIQKCLSQKRIESYQGSSSDSDLEDTSKRFEKDYLKRDQRLQRIRKVYKEEERENKKDLLTLKKNYIKHHNVLKERNNKQTNLKVKDEKAANKRGRKEAGRQRKRSASTSPFRRRKFRDKLVLNEDEILPVMEEEFPFIHLSPHTAKLLHKKQVRQKELFCKETAKKTKSHRSMEDAERRQQALAALLTKEIEHNKRIKERKERIQEEAHLKRQLKERRQMSARSTRYYEDFVIRNKARMLKKRTKEEKLFKDLFEDGVAIQKERIRELRQYAREKKEKNDQKHQQEIESLENYYRDQFSMLAETVSQEKYELEVRQKAQAKVLEKMRTEMRRRMETDVRVIQNQLANDDDGIYFRKVDAENLKKGFQLATYKTTARK